MKLPKSWKRISSALLLTGSLLLTGCGDSENFVFTNDQFGGAPVAVNDTVNSLGNATLQQTAANGVLANDALNGATITAFDATSTQGATVVVNADGSFTYTPLFGVIGNDTFTYTLTNGDGSSTGTVTVTLTGEAFFVDNSQAANGNGGQASPFNNLADAIAAAGNGDTVFVLRGDGTNNNLAGAVNLPQGVSLVGEGAGLVVAQTIVPAGQNPILTGPITLNGDNTVSGFTIDGSAGDGIEANGVTNVTITDNTFQNNTGVHVDLIDVGGTLTATGNTFNAGVTTAVDYFSVVNTDTNLTANVSNNTFNDDGTIAPRFGIGMGALGTSVYNLTLNTNTFTSPDNAASFDTAIICGSTGTAQITATANGNNIDRTSNDGIDFTAFPGTTITATANANTVSNVLDNCLGFDSEGGTVVATADSNILSNSQDGIDADVENGANASVRLIATGNMISNMTEEGIDIDGITGFNTATLVAALRGNTITGADPSIEVISNNETVCLDITGNTVDANMDFDGDGGTVQVERLDVANGGPLDTVNTFTAGAVVTANTVNSVAIGTCNIP